MTTAASSELRRLKVRVQQQQRDSSAAAAMRGERSHGEQALSQERSRAVADGGGAAVAEESSWTCHTDPSSGRLYWHCAATGETSWDNPSESATTII